MYQYNVQFVVPTSFEVEIELQRAAFLQHKQRKLWNAILLLYFVFKGHRYVLEHRKSPFVCHRTIFKVQNVLFVPTCHGMRQIILCYDKTSSIPATCLVRLVT